jgi:flagellar hook-associated protein 1 FlgK
MSSFSALEIGKRALLAQRFGIEVTSNNIANVNTAGYSRRSAVLSESSPVYRNGQFMGTGAVAEKLRTFREEFFDRELRSTISRHATFENDEKVFQRIEAVLAEPSELNILNDVTSFLSSFEELAIKPEDMGLRDNILSRAQTLVDKLNRTASQLTEARNELATEISLNINQINSLIAEVAELNKNIANSKTISQTEAQTYVDQRQLKLEELSKLAGVSVTFEQDGSANVFLNGINLITGSNYNTLRRVDLNNFASGEISIAVEIYDKSKDLATRLNPQAGTLASNLKHFNETLDPNESQSFSIFKQLDDFVDTLAQRINQLVVGGYGLKDTTSPPPGRLFFEPATGRITAATIKISNDIKNSPENLPFSKTPGTPGNAEIALAIGRIAQDSKFLNGQRPYEFYSAFIGKIGSLSREATTGKDTTRLVSEQLSNQRESVIGVNTDEEAVNLIRFQKAFEAASRIVNVTNDLLSTVINLGR